MHALSLFVLLSRPFCSQPFPCSGWVFVSISKLSTEDLSVMAFGGCHSQGCHGYLHVHLRLPQFIQAPSPHPSVGDEFKKSHRE